MKKIFLSILLSISLLFGQAFAADEWLKTQPAGTDLINDLDTIIQENNAGLDRLLSTYNSIQLAYSSGSAITASAGSVVCSNSDGSVRKMRLNTSTTSVSFTDIDTGAEASATTYYVYANCDADATTATFKVSASSSAPTGVTSYKKVGSFYNNSSSDIDRTKIYTEPYGSPFTDSSGIQMLQAIYDYGTSNSSFTSKSGGLLVAFGEYSIGASSSVSISNLPFTSSSTYQCFAGNPQGGTTQFHNACTKSSGSAMTVYNVWSGGTASVPWLAIGY